MKHLVTLGLLCVVTAAPANANRWDKVTYYLEPDESEAQVAHDLGAPTRMEVRTCGTAPSMDLQDHAWTCKIWLYETAGRPADGVSYEPVETLQIIFRRSGSTWVINGWHVS